MSYYSKSELRAKGEEIVDEAVAATIREADSCADAQDGLHRDEHGTDAHGSHEYSHEEVEGWVREQLAWIPDHFEREADPEPDNFEGISDAVNTTMSKLGGGDSASADPNIAFSAKAQAEIEEWDGVFSENFQNGFTIPFPTIVQNQAAVAKMLNDSLGAIVNVYRGKRRDYSELADQTIAALKNCGARDGGDEKMGLTILGAVAGIAAAALAIPSGGTSLYVGGIVLATIAGSAAIGGETVPKEKNLALGAPTVMEVISNMISRQSDIYTAVYDQEEKIAGVLDGNYELLTSVRQLGAAKRIATPLTPLRPSIADAEDPSSGLTPE
ncbi:hypothetical protein LX16_4309 [Stackebrandtia albiflava]|uniref:Uncharacterized protein n=1 Tax=Stackebrandtia albiflava TaxID=406432 RepID=A0A562UR46_9ACTN|nr:hypothetical protein [Stackebrandtia albiflava]TWJ08089.1 hypothetical protein LX16_4309 [Stackebrandtia albiflava]